MKDSMCPSQDVSRQHMMRKEKNPSWVSNYCCMAIKTFGRKERDMYTSRNKGMFCLGYRYVSSCPRYTDLTTHRTRRLEIHRLVARILLWMRPVQILAGRNGDRKEVQSRREKDCHLYGYRIRLTMGGTFQSDTQLMAASQSQRGRGPGLAIKCPILAFTWWTVDIN